MMTDDELKRVVTKIQLGDNRQVDRLVLLEWRDSIGDLNFADAIEAVSMHRRESGDPKPDNWEAMCKAYKDPIAFAREVAIYDQQLVDAGLNPTQPRRDKGWAA